MRALARLWLEHRKRLAPAVVIAAVAVVGNVLLGAFPREVTIRYDLGPAHAAVTEARIAYTLSGEEVKGVRYGYESGAPAFITHTLELSPGRYEVVASLWEGERQRRIVRPLTVPTEGQVRMVLYDQALASRNGGRAGAR